MVLKRCQYLRSARSPGLSSRSDQWPSPSVRAVATRRGKTRPCRSELSASTPPWLRLSLPCLANSSMRRAETPGPYAEAEARKKDRCSRRVRLAREMLAGRTSEFCPARPTARKTRSGLCSNPATRAGSCPQLRQYQDVHRKKHVLPGKDAAQKELPADRCQRVQILRLVPQGRRRRLPLWEVLSIFPSSGQAFQKALSQDL